MAVASSTVVIMQPSFLAAKSKCSSPKEACGNSQTDQQALVGTWDLSLSTGNHFYQDLHRSPPVSLSEGEVESGEYLFQQYLLRPALG